MRRLIILAASLVLWGSLVEADGGVDLILKGGLIDNYSQRGLNLPVYNIEKLNLIGGQFKISKLPIVDIIAGADYSWRDRTYRINNQELEFRARDLAVTVSAVYPLEVGMAEIYLGGGIGSHSISYEYRRPPTLVLEDFGVEIPGTSAYFGYHGMVGGSIDIPATKLGIFMEMRLNRIETPINDISYNTWSAGLCISLE